jgi:hypothetical protein
LFYQLKELKNRFFLGGFCLFLDFERRKDRMGICFSSFGGKNGEREWNSVSNNSTSRLDLKLGKTTSGSGDFASFISKFGGGGAAAAAEERALHQIPGRVVANGGSKVACLYTQQGKKGTNQDAMIVWEVSLP